MRLSKTTEEIEIYERYDKEDDVYYVTLRTGEPSVVQEGNDDMLLIEVGIFTRMPTGYRILNYTKCQPQADRFKSSFIEICKRLGLQRIKESETWKRAIDKTLEKVA